MIQEKELVNASVKYRKGREQCGVKDPILLDEVEEAYYLGAEWADETILSKIKSLINEWGYGNSTEAKYKVEAYKDLIEIIENGE